MKRLALAAILAFSCTLIAQAENPRSEPSPPSSASTLKTTNTN